MIDMKVNGVEEMSQCDICFKKRQIKCLSISFKLEERKSLKNLSDFQPSIILENGFLRLTASILFSHLKFHNVRAFSCITLTVDLEYW
jgi:hypothetical protein